MESSGDWTAFFEVFSTASNQSVCSTIVSETDCVLVASGEHKIVVRDFTNNHIGSYALFLQRLNNPVGCASMSFGALPIPGTVSAAAEIDCFMVDATIGDRIRTRVVETAGKNLTIHFEIMRPDGTSLCSTVVGEKDCHIDQTGPQIILVKDFDGTTTGDYSLYVQRLNEPAGCAALSFGALPAIAQIKVAAEVDCYTFPGVANDTVRIRAIETDNGPLSLFFELFDPAGGSVCSEINPEQTCTLSVDGQYMLLTKDFAGTKTGDYSLYLQRLNSPVGCASLGLSGGQSTIEVAAQVNCYTFQATGNGDVTLNVHEEAGQLSAYSEIVRPDGTTACETILADLTCTLSGSGVHTILVDDFSGIYTGTYQITLQCPAGNCRFAATPTPTQTPLPTLTQTPVPPTGTPSPTENANKVFVPLVSR
ncbi:MAG: hypothetical protein U0175_27000 [Caldilineaceae bacterium]